MADRSSDRTDRPRRQSRRTTTVRRPAADQRAAQPARDDRTDRPAQPRRHPITDLLLQVENALPGHGNNYPELLKDLECEIDYRIYGFGRGVQALENLSESDLTKAAEYIRKQLDGNATGTRPRRPATQPARVERPNSRPAQRSTDRSIPDSGVVGWRGRDGSDDLDFGDESDYRVRRSDEAIPRVAVVTTDELFARACGDLRTTSRNKLVSALKAELYSQSVEALSHWSEEDLRTLIEDLESPPAVQPAILRADSTAETRVEPPSQEAKLIDRAQNELQLTDLKQVWNALTDYLKNGSDSEHNTFDDWTGKELNALENALRDAIKKSRLVESSATKRKAAGWSSMFSAICALLFGWIGVCLGGVLANLVIGVLPPDLLAGTATVFRLTFTIGITAIFAVGGYLVAPTLQKRSRIFRKG